MHVSVLPLNLVILYLTRVVVAVLLSKMTVNEMVYSKWESVESGGMGRVSGGSAPRLRLKY